MRLREPFFSIFTELKDQFSLDQFIALTIKGGFEYKKMEEVEVRKIVYFQIFRLCQANAIVQVVGLEKRNLIFRKTPDKEIVTKLSERSILAIHNADKPRRCQRR